MTRTGTRYGCFLSDLAGLARDPSTANLPAHYIRFRRPKGNPQGNDKIRKNLMIVPAPLPRIPAPGINLADEIAQFLCRPRA